MQLKTVTADWTMSIKLSKTRRVLLHTQVIAPEDSILILSATFDLSSVCGKHHSYVNFRLDNEKTSSFNNLLAYREGTASPYPGSFMQVVKVKKGPHIIELYLAQLKRPNDCDHIITRTTMQVGVVPLSF